MIKQTQLVKYFPWKNNMKSLFLMLLLIMETLAIGVREAKEKREKYLKGKSKCVLFAYAL